MKTLSDIKKAMELGTRWHTVNHITNKDFGVRPISQVRSNEIALLTDHQGCKTDSWIKFPKAKNIQFNNEDSFTVTSDDGKPILTYTRITTIEMLIDEIYDYIKDTSIEQKTLLPLNDLYGSGSRWCNKKLFESVYNQISLYLYGKVSQTA
jgi:hypothetical protein